jgi:hypothetical protein
MTRVSLSFSVANRIFEILLARKIWAGLRVRGLFVADGQTYPNPKLTKSNESIESNRIVVAIDLAKGRLSASPGNFPCEAALQTPPARLLRWL